jgi:hypothetical protein
MILLKMHIINVNKSPERQNDKVVLQPTDKLSPNVKNAIMIEVLSNRHCSSLLPSCSSVLLHNDRKIKNWVGLGFTVH